MTYLLNKPVPFFPIEFKKFIINNKKAFSHEEINVTLYII